MSGLRKRHGGAKVEHYLYSLSHSKIKPFFKSLAESLDFLQRPELLVARSADFLLAADRDGRQMRHNLTGQYLQWKLQLCQRRQLLWDTEFQPPPALDDWCGEEDCLFWKVLVIQLLMLVLLSTGGGWVRVCAIMPRWWTTSYSRRTGKCCSLVRSPHLTSCW